MNNLFQPDKDYMVLARCHTYNHEKYIEHTLNGFVMQKTSFPFCAVVIDDCSTDTNQEVISQYVKSKCGESIEQGENDNFRWMIGQPAGNEQCTLVVLLLKYNHYQKGLIMKPYYEAWQNACKYEALCEGDDYWTDPLKLQKQVDILEADHTLMACCTNNAQVDAAGNKIGEVLQFQQGARYTIRDFVEKCPIYPTLTVMYRNVHTDEINQIAKRIQTSFVGDWPRWAAIHLFGDFYVLPDITAAYRINPTSVTHTCNRIARVKTDVQMCLNLADELPASQEDLAAQLRDTSWKWLAYVRACKAERKYLRMLWYLLLTSILTPRSIIKLFRKDA